ncbi:MAG TPA: helicase HerA-like domain-containing protein [Vicinamibacteria bacterium]
MAATLYLGRQVDPATGALGAEVRLDPGDLLTHGLIVGMTGSGKTGLAIAMIEEVLKQGIPVLAIDPKGDLGNLLLLFDRLDQDSFAPWVDADAARREGKTVEAAAAEAAAAWKKGLAEWGLSEKDAAALCRAREAVIYTPGSTAGVPLNVLESLAAPAVPFADAEEELRDEISGIVSGLLALARIEADPLRSRESILLSTLIESAWRQGRSLSLEELIGAVDDPPFAKLGALPLESTYPRKDRQGLMQALNALLASPRFEAWRQGEALDMDRLLGAGGRPRLSVVYTAHLADEERLFVTALLLDKVKTWMRRQAGTTELRALVYMDEIYGYFPPHPADPPPKRPLLTLLKQARAQGVGVVLATQNPVDLDYKGLANAGLWLVGRLQTEQDRARLREGLTEAGSRPRDLDRLLDATKKRVFLMHDVHRPGPILLYSRWTLSYLRGPLTRQEISRLTKGQPAAAAADSAPRESAPPAATARPSAPDPLRHLYLNRYGGELANPHLFVKYAMRHKGSGETVAAQGYPITDRPLSELLEAEPIAVDEAKIATDPPAGLRYPELPAGFAAANARAIEKVLRERLADKLEQVLFYDPVTRTQSRPGEDRQAFAARLAAEATPQDARLRERLERKRQEITAAEQEVSGRRTEKWTALGTAILSNIGLMTGRKRTITGAGSVLTKNRLEGSAEARLERLKSEAASLEQQLSERAPDPARFEEKRLVPTRADLALLRYDLLWVY